MLTNINTSNLKDSIKGYLQTSENESLLIAKRLIENLDIGFETSLKTWIEEKQIVNVKFRNMDIFSLMHYLDMNYIEAIEVLNLYISNKTLESIKTCRKLRRKDKFWKMLACIFGC